MVWVLGFGVRDLFCVTGRWMSLGPAGPCQAGAYGSSLPCRLPQVHILLYLAHPGTGLETTSPRARNLEI